MISDFLSSVFHSAARAVSFPWTIVDQRRRTRRKAIFEKAFPPQWGSILRDNVPLYQLMPQELRRQLEGHILVFLSEKRFEGCAGQNITDEVKLTIAAQACLLLLNRETNYYPRFSTILVYPSTYVASHRQAVGGTCLEGEVIRLGESWDHDYVVLSWDDVKQGGMDITDGHNVTLHEFAHQLDQEDGTADGVPILGQQSHYVTWARVLSGEYRDFCSQISLGREVLFNEYGATNPAEFFAVITEMFFEKPLQLKGRHLELYDELCRLYQVDPTEWLAKASISNYRDT